MDARDPFFYFFQSRREPSKDDVIFWTNGGLGCSLSAMGLPMELGPCRVVQDDGAIKLIYHPQLWNEIILSVSSFRTRSMGSGL